MWAITPSIRVPQVANVKLDTAKAVRESDFGPLLMKWGFVTSDASIDDGDDSLVGLSILWMSLGLWNVWNDQKSEKRFIWNSFFIICQDVTEQIKLLSKKMQAMQEQLANLVTVAGNKSDKWWTIHSSTTTYLFS